MVNFKHYFFIAAIGTLFNLQGMEQDRIDPATCINGIEVTPQSIIDLAHNGQVQRKLSEEESTAIKSWMSKYETLLVGLNTIKHSHENIKEEITENREIIKQANNQGIPVKEVCGNYYLPILIEDGKEFNFIVTGPVNKLNNSLADNNKEHLNAMASKMKWEQIADILKNLKKMPTVHGLSRPAHHLKAREVISNNGFKTVGVTRVYPIAISEKGEEPNDDHYIIVEKRPKGTPLMVDKKTGKIDAALSEKISPATMNEVATTGVEGYMFEPAFSDCNCHAVVNDKGKVIFTNLEQANSNSSQEFWNRRKDRREIYGVAGLEHMAAVLKDNPDHLQQIKEVAKNNEQLKSYHNYEALKVSLGI